MTCQWLHRSHKYHGLTKSSHRRQTVRLRSRSAKSYIGHLSRLGTPSPRSREPAHLNIWMAYSLSTTCLITTVIVNIKHQGPL